MRILNGCGGSLCFLFFFFLIMKSTGRRFDRNDFFTEQKLTIFWRFQHLYDYLNEREWIIHSEIIYSPVHRQCIFNHCHVQIVGLRYNDYQKIDLKSFGISARSWSKLEILTNSKDNLWKVGRHSLVSWKRIDKSGIDIGNTFTIFDVKSVEQWHEAKGAGRILS